MRIAPPGLAAAWLAALAVSGAGCSATKKKIDCAKLTSTVNDGVARAKAAVGTGKGPAAMRNFADVYEKLGADLATLDVSTPAIAKDVEDYRAVCRDAVHAARNEAAAAEAHDVAAQKAAAGEFEGAKKAEESLVARVNGACL